MRNFKTYMLAFTVLVSSQAYAQDATTSSSPPAAIQSLMNRDSVVPPVLTWLQQQGSKLTLIGEEAGLKGYLVESPSGKMQSVYVTPDGKHIIAGILFQQGGKNVTGVQIGEMRKRFDTAAKALDDRAASSSVVSDPASETTGSAPEADGEASPSVQTTEPTQASPADSGIPTPEANLAAPSVSVQEAPEATLTPVAPVAPALAAPSNVSPEVDATNIVLPEATMAVEGADGNPSDVWLSKIDKDQFLKAADATPFFEVGSRLAPTTVWMVADVTCPYCHSAWASIEPLVFDKKVKVRVVLIDALNSEKLAREILASPNPSRRWYDSKGGVNLDAQVDPNSKEYADSKKYLDMNMEFARSFGVDRTPFLAYVAPNGQFYSALGLPSDLTSFLAASGAVSK